jgi:hypothetical protein
MRSGWLARHLLLSVVKRGGDGDVEVRPLTTTQTESLTARWAVTTSTVDSLFLF